MMKFILTVSILVMFIPGGDALTCHCRDGFVCAPSNANTTDCTGDATRCFSLVRRLSGGTEEIRKGCTKPEECESREGCAEDESQTCLKFGCCSTTLCVANFTYIYTPPSPSPSPTPTPAEIRTSTGVPQIPTSTVAPAPETTQIMPVEQSSPIVEASPSAMASKPAMVATSSLPMEMSSEPVMASSKTKEEMMSSSVEKMKPSPSQIAGGTAVVNTLVMPGGSTADPRPPCPDSSQRVYSLGVFALVVIALLCDVF